MSIDRCIVDLTDKGEITPENAAEVSGLFGALQQDLRRQFGDQAADAMASDATLRALEAAAARKRANAGRTIATRQRIEFDMARYAGGAHGDGPIPPGAAEALLAAGDGRAGYSSVEGRWKAIRARAHAEIDQVLSDHSANLLGQVRERAQLIDITRERFGEDSGNAVARELSQSIERATEMLRTRFNAAGGDIGKMDNWGLPQSHDSRAIRQAGYEAWRAEIWDRLDRPRMIDKRSGMPFSDEALELALRDVFETIRTDGWNTRTPGTAGRPSLINSHTDARFLHFKSADDWMAYAERFGSGNAFDAMMSHIDGMSRDVAMLEILGPNPGNTVDWIKGTLEKRAAMDLSPGTTAIEQATAAGKKIDRLWSELNGDAHRPESRSLALTFSTIRLVQTAAKLGGALLSAPSDMAFQMSTRALNGLPVFRGMIGDYVKLIKPGSVEDRRLAVRLGLIADEWSNHTMMQNRYLGEEMTAQWARRLAEGVMRVQGLSRWTQAGRYVFGMEFIGTLTEQRGKSFDALDAGLRGVMQRYGISADDWDAIRATPLEMDRGVEWLKPANVVDRALGDRLLEMILTETDFAVPVPDLRTRATLGQITPRGTWAGETAKSALLFKSFGVSIMLMHGRRAIELGGGRGARYAAGLVIGTTLLGALSMQLKAIAAGKDPRPMDDEKFWGAALFQGGGLGIFGDFLSSTTNRFGGGLSATIAGPIAGDIEGLANIATTKPDKRAATAIREVKGMIPGSTLWYTRLAFDRMVADQLRELADPDYADAWRRMERRAADDRTQYWWAPGDTVPERAPDLSNSMPGVSDASPGYPGEVP